MNWGSPTYIFIWLIAYLLITAWIAWKYSTGIETEEDYYVAGRSVGPFANTMTILATVMSGGIYLGTVGFFYQHGVNFLGYGFAYAGMVFALWFVGKRLWPVGKKFNYSTPQDLYGDLYQSEFLRLFGAVGSIIFLIPYFASNAVAMGTILERFAGLPYVWGVLLLMVFCTATFQRKWGRMAKLRSTIRIAVTASALAPRWVRSTTAASPTHWSTGIAAMSRPAVR